MLPWWGWVLIVIVAIIAIIIISYMLRNYIPLCGVICEVCDSVGEGINDIDFGDLGGDD